MIKKIILIVSMATILVLIIILFINNNTTPIDTSFANSASLKYHYIDKDIDVIITDGEDINALKKMFARRTYKDNLSCGFSPDISVTLSNGNQSITFCPARDGCPNIQIGDSNMYIRITSEQRNLLNSILGKYGMIFPCI